MEEFGFSKEIVENFVEGTVNAKGEITNQAKYVEAIFKLMALRSEGAMERLAQTIPGRWSNVRERLQTIFFTIGKGFEKPILNAITVIERVMTNMQNSGVFERIAQWASQTFSVQNMKNFGSVLLRTLYNAVNVIDILKQGFGFMTRQIQIWRVTIEGVGQYLSALLAGGNLTSRGRDLFAIAQGTKDSAHNQQLGLNAEIKSAWENRPNRYAENAAKANAVINKLFAGLNDAPVRFKDQAPAYFGNPQQNKKKSDSDRLIETILGGGELARIGIRSSQYGGTAKGKGRNVIRVEVDAGPSSPLNKALGSIFETFLVQAIRQGKVAVPGQ
jgi:hypothetical protein